VSFELVPFDASHRDDYIRLLAEAWGNRGLTTEEFEWWFGRNPAGSILRTALVDGQVAGVGAHMLARMIVAGEERRVSWSCHAVTSPAATGRGIFTELQRALDRAAEEQGIELVLGFGNEVTNPMFFERLGWSDVARYRIWARPRPVVRRHGEVVATLDIAGDAASDWRNHLVRDELYLRWRYEDSPRPYVTVRSEKGYAVVWPAKPMGSRTIAVLSDLAAPSKEVPGLLRRAAGAAGSRFLFGLPAPTQRGAFARAGFVPTHLTMHLIGRGLNGPLDSNPAAWQFTLGDADYY
jgi:GNAT superfamily N-acetyltransferase